MRLGEESFAGDSELDLLTGAIEQLHTELTLQLRDGGRDGGLHDVDAPRRPGEAALDGDRNEVLDLA